MTASGAPPTTVGAGPVSRPRIIGLVVAVASAVVFVDQFTKTLVVDRLGDRIVPVVWTLQLNVSLNSGAAFGRGRGLTGLITVVAVPLVVGIAWWACRATRPVIAVALALLVGGAAGNLSDRLFRGHDGAVIDFLDFQWWPVFNVADIALSIGSVLLIVASFREPSAPT